MHSDNKITNKVIKTKSLIKTLRTMKHYIAHYTTPSGQHRSKEYTTEEQARAHKGKVWAVTIWENINGVHTGTALSVNMNNY